MLVLAGACELVCLGSGTEFAFALAMLFAVPLVWADIVLAEELVRGLVWLEKKRWKLLS